MSKTIEQWVDQLSAVLVEGTQALVDSNSTSDRFLPDAIAWAEYTKDNKGLEVNHAGVCHTDKLGDWWISEEKKLMAGVASTTLSEYLASGCNIIFRAPKKKLTKFQIGMLDKVIKMQSGNFRYRVGGLFTELWPRLKEKANKILGTNMKTEEVDYKPKPGIYICSEWSMVSLCFSTGEYKDWKGKAPKDIQEDARFYDLAIWFGKAQQLIIFA